MRLRHDTRRAKGHDRRRQDGHSGAPKVTFLCSAFSASSPPSRGQETLGADSAGGRRGRRVWQGALVGRNSVGRSAKRALASTHTPSFSSTPSVSARRAHAPLRPLRYMPSGKAKRAALQERRQRARERPRPEYDDDTASSAIPKVVQCRCYPTKLHRGAPSTVKLKLSIDRQLCAGFRGDRSNHVVPNAVRAAVAAAAATQSAAAHEAEATGPASARVEVTAAERTVKSLRARATALQAKLSATTKLKSASDVDREWTWGMNTAVQLLSAAATAYSDEGADLSPLRGPLFMVMQQALQTGPLSFGKPAQFKRFAKALRPERLTHSFGHPHARAVRKLLDALDALLPSPHSMQSTMAESASAGAPDVGDAARSADAADAADSATAAGGTDSAPASAPPSAVSRQLFSDKQCEVVRGWLVDFNRAFEGGDIVKNAAAERAGAGHRLGRGAEAEAEDLAVSVDDGEGYWDSSVVTVVASNLEQTGASSAASERERRLAALARRGIS